jgi:hypothetical protein
MDCTILSRSIIILCFIQYFFSLNPCTLTCLMVTQITLKRIMVPLKIRIFMWFLHRKVILTKVNMVKCNWYEDVKWCLCDQEETIQHLFIPCSFTRMIRRIVYMAFNIPPPLNIAIFFGNWLNWVSKKDKAHIRVGVCVVLWAVRKVHENCIFNTKVFPLFLQVSPLATYWIYMWSYLQSEDQHLGMDTGYATDW